MKGYKIKFNLGLIVLLILFQIIYVFSVSGGSSKSISPPIINFENKDQPTLNPVNTSNNDSLINISSIKSLNLNQEKDLNLIVVKLTSKVTLLSNILFILFFINFIFIIYFIFSILKKKFYTL